jgi:hypothetical protein
MKPQGGQCAYDERNGFVVCFKRRELECADLILPNTIEDHEEEDEIISLMSDGFTLLCGRLTPMEIVEDRDDLIC